MRFEKGRKPSSRLADLALAEADDRYWAEVNMRILLETENKEMKSKLGRVREIDFNKLLWSWYEKKECPYALTSWDDRKRFIEWVEGELKEKIREVVESG